MGGHPSQGNHARSSAKQSFGWSRAKALVSPAKRENVLSSIIQGTSCVSRRPETSCVRQVQNRYFPRALAELTTNSFASPNFNPNGGTTTPSCQQSNTPKQTLPIGGGSLKRFTAFGS